MSVAKRVLALALVELIFLSEKTLRTPNVGRRMLILLLGEFVFWIVAGDEMFLSHIWGGQVP